MAAGWTRFLRRGVAPVLVAVLSTSLVHLGDPDARATSVRQAWGRVALPLPTTAPLEREERIVRAASTALFRVVAQARVPKPKPAVLVRITTNMQIHARPGGGRTIGVMPPRSRFLGTETVAWVLKTSANGRYGRVTIPYSGRSATGWISLKGLTRARTHYSVHVDLSKHLLTVRLLDRTVFRAPAATGATRSPTPAGLYFVSDRVSAHVGSAFGSFAFGLSGIQTHLPPGWGGSGDQLAIHGTNDPGSIGQSASAGCVRVSEATLARLKPLLQLGTPVTIRP